MPDGSTHASPHGSREADSAAKCGIVLIGHGNTASALLAAARSLIPGEGLADIVAIDAGVGQTPELTARVCEAIERVEEAPLGETVAVWITGTLHGERPDGTPFEGVRFVDRFSVRAGQIERQDVWNDMGEMGLSPTES